MKTKRGHPFCDSHLTFYHKLQFFIALWLQFRRFDFIAMLLHSSIVTEILLNYLLDNRTFVVLGRWRDTEV